MQKQPHRATPSTAVLADLRCAGSCVCIKWISWLKVRFARAERSNLEDDACHQNHVRVRRELPVRTTARAPAARALNALVRSARRHVA